MARPEYESLLPRVEEKDLLDLVFEDVVDPSHQQRWKRFAHTNPRLAQELLKISFISTRDDQPGQPERQKVILDILSYAVSALEYAARREREDTSALPEIKSDDDADGEDRPLSA